MDGSNVNINAVNNEKLLLLQKLFQYITNYIIGNDIFRSFHEQFEKIDNNGSTMDAGIGINDAIDFMQVFLKNSRLDVEYAEYVSQMCTVGKHKLMSLLENTSQNMIPHIIESYRCILNTYFDRPVLLSPVYINMFYEYLLLDGDLNLSQETRIIKSIVRGGGPIMIKTLQQFAHKEDLSTEFRDILNDVYDNLSPVCELELDILKPILHVTQLTQEPISVASIGEVHHGKMGDVSVVVKFIKPRSLLYILSEIIVLSKISDTLDKKSREYTKYKIYKIGKEFSFNKEQEHGNRINKIFNTSSVTSIKILDAKDTPVPCLIMTYGKGISLRQFISNNTEIDKINLLVPAFRELIRLWLTNTVLGDGFSHADLHPGNILVDTECTPYKITLIDFGSAAVLNKNQQYFLLKVIDIHQAIIKSGGNDKMYRRCILAFCNFCGVTVDKDEMTYLSNEVSHFYTKNNNYIFGDLIKELLLKMKNIGECTSGDLVDFGKGFYFIETSWESLGIPSNLIDTYIESIRYYPYTILQLLYKKLLYTIYT